METKTELNAEIVKIDINGKYIFLVNGMMSIDEIERTKQKLKDWLKRDNDPFVFINGDHAKLVKIE